MKHNKLQRGHVDGIPADVPPEKQALLNSLLQKLIEVRGVEAVVLGGSYARGTQRPGSDLDVGLYYLENAPFAIDDMRRVAAELSASGSAVVTGFYEWGAWVNGGAWIHTSAGKVDFLYRSIEHVQRTIDGALKGNLQHDYDQQPAYGFYSVIYLGETKVCRALYDPAGRVAHLKEQVASYPPALKQKTIQSGLWLAEFSLLHAAGFAKTGDVYTTAGALVRAAAYLTQVLFALNEVYFISDKTALKEIAAFPLAPAGYGKALSAVLARPGQNPAELETSTLALKSLWSQVVQLTGGTYQPAFAL